MMFSNIFSSLYNIFAFAHIIHCYHYFYHGRILELDLDLKENVRNF